MFRQWWLLLLEWLQWDIAGKLHLKGILRMEFVDWLNVGGEKEVLGDFKVGLP